MPNFPVTIVLVVLLAGLAAGLGWRLRIVRREAGRLRRLAGRSELILGAMAEGVYGLDADGTLTFVNPAGAALLGYEPEELIGRPQAELLVGAEAGGSTRAGRATTAADGTLRRKDGTSLPVAYRAAPIRTRGRPSGVVVTFRDLSERVELAERTEGLARERAARERYHLLFDRSPHPKWVYDLETLRFLAVNGTAVEIYGFSEEEFLAMTLADIRPAADVPAMFREMAVREASGRDGPAETTHRHRRKDGTLLEVEIASLGIRFEGRRARLVEIRDVTDRRRLEEQLRQLQKMEAVGQLAGGVAHDFNNLLTAILAGAESLLLREPTGSELREEAAEIRRAALRGAELTRQLLAFGRREIVAPRVLDLNELVSGMDSMLRRLISESVELHVTPAPALGAVRADPGQLEQLLMNLVVNASDAMPAGGSLRIETREAPGRHVMLAVSDTGTGMDAALQERIFEPFFTTKAQGHGTGLGLSTVYGIVKQNGGDIKVTSAPGAGSTFRIYLPCVDEAYAAAPAPPEQAAALRGEGTILLVEDQDPVRAVARKILRRHGYMVLEAASPSAAVEVAAGHPGTIDLLLTDVILPEMNGRELAERLQAARPGMRVLFMSGYTEDVMLRHGALTAGVQLLEKPFTLVGLLERVREVMGTAISSEVHDPTS